MAIVVDNCQLLFIHIPKNAGSSISAWLVDHGGKHADQIRHSSLQDSKLDISKFFSFCVVRNPWDRMVSLYMYALKVSNQSNIAFSDWLRANYKFTRHWYSISTPQVDWIKQEPNLIIRYENLNQGFKYIQEKLNSNQPLPRINGSNKKHYSLYYDEWSMNFVAELYIKDIERFNYKFEKMNIAE